MMDFETIWFLLVTFVIIGVLSYAALKLLRFMNDTRSMSELDHPNTLTSWRKKASNETTGTKESLERVAKSATDSMTQFSTDKTILEVPSRQRIAEESDDLTRERDIQDARDNLTTSDNDTEGKDEESDQDDNDCKAFMAFVNEEELYKLIHKLGVLRGLIMYINENLQTWMTRELKIAIIGNSGTGKSSLINAIMGLKPEDNGAAGVGVTETTIGTQKYVLPKNENISLWDLPGVGTQKFKKEDYLETINLKEFDAFMIVSATRFTENDIWLATEILKYQSCVLFLRTKIDLDLYNEKSDHPRTFNEVGCLQKIRNDIASNLMKTKFLHKRCEIYLVSSRQSDKFEFSNLLNRLNIILSKKRFAIRKRLEILLQKQLSRKIKEAAYISLISTLFIVIGLVRSKTLTRRIYRICQTSFSLDDKTLKMISDEIDMPVKHLKTKELKYFMEFGKEQSKERADRKVDLNEFRIRLNAACDVMGKDEAKLISLRLKYLEKQLQPL